MQALLRAYKTAILLGLAAGLCATPSVLAQVAGTNVNMVSGTQWPNGDPFLQRQNEPSMAVSTRNPMHIVAGANDYRTVDLETVLSGGAETGDAWLGLFKSFDGGLTWQSTLLPGCSYAVPQCLDNGALNNQYQAASDPVVRAGTNGMFYYAGLAFDRATGPGQASSVSSIFVARYNDLNNNENLDPIAYIDTHVVASGNSSQFLDKPSMAVDIPRAGAATCSFNANEPGAGPNGGTLTVHQSFPAGNVYLAYTDFLAATKDNGTPTHLMFTRSTDCGVTWSTPVQINTGTTTSQGSAIAVNPLNGNVYVAWRQFASSGISDAIMIAQSTNAGKSFGTPVQISTFQPFDQGTTGTSFRTNAYPALTTDMFGFVYVAFSARGLGPSGDARIVAAGSIDGKHWTPAIMVDNPSQDAQTNPSGRGHQIMPAITFANGRLTLLYYDLRLDHYAGFYNPVAGNPGNYVETLEPEGELAPPSPMPNEVFTTFIDDAGLTLRRHTLDLRVLELGIFPTVVLGPSVLVSQYEYGCCVNPATPDIEQFKFNVPNLPLFALGEEPFLGDYIDIVASPLFVAHGNTWNYNFMPSVNPLFHATWTDNRDVVPPPPGGSWQNYTAPVVAGAISVENGAPLPACVPGQEGMRNQNIYTAQITGGLVVGAPGNAKPLGTTTFTNPTTGVVSVVPFQRAFPVEAQNVSGQQIFVRFSIANQPPGGSASFLQFSLLTTLDVTVPAYSSVSRSVFVTSTNPEATITVNVSQITAIGGSVVTNGLSGTAVLNPDITNPNITNPNITNPNITNPNITNAEVTNPNITNPNITNPNITNSSTENPNITNPNITNTSYLNPNITNPNITNLNVTNISAANPNITNPNITNPNITNPNITNPNITNPDITNGSIQDVTYPITNNGNTTSSYTVKIASSILPPNGIVLQLLLNKLYQTPVAENCVLGVQTHWVTVANIVNPKLFSPTDPNVGNPDITNSAPNEASVTLAPGETAFITIRVVNPTPATTPFNPLTVITPVTVPQAVNTITVLSNPGNTTLTAPAVYPPITILSPATLPATDQADPGVYSFQLQSSGGKPGTDTWTIIGGALPNGMSLSPSGLITGQTTALGPNSATIQVADSAIPPNTFSKTFSIPVNGVFQKNVIGIINDGVVGQAYVAIPFTTTGGTSPLTWAATGLPPGLSINPSSGQISGIPTVANPTGSTVQVTVTDSALPPVVLPATITIRVGAVIQIAPSTLPGGVIGIPYSVQLTATGGIGSYVFGPPSPATGVLLSSSGLLTIQNPLLSTISFSVSVHDQANPNQFQNANYTILFAAPAVGNVTFTAQPQNSVGGQLLSGSPITVLVTDASSAPVAGVTVTMSFNGTPPCGTANLGGTLSQMTAANGVATFPDLSVDRGQLGYTLRASVSPASGVSNAFTVNGFCGTGSLSTARAYPTAALIKGGQVLIAGGQTSAGASNAADIYDPGTGTVTGFATMNTARFKHTATTLNNGTVLIVGGQLDNSGNPALATTAELYLPGTGTFANTTNAPNVARTGGHTATLLADGTVLIAGGVGSGGNILQSAEIYSPANQTFTVVGPLNHARYQHTATLLANGKVLIAGGSTSDNSAELYDPVAQTFTLTGNLSTARLNPSGTLLPNGQVLIAGGLGSISTAELYDPVAGTFTLTGSLNTARGAQTATLLTDGTVLVAGGFNCSFSGCAGNPIVGTAEIYNPATFTFTNTGSLINGRWQDAVTILNDGTVLISGGFGGNFLATSERYFSTAPLAPMLVTTTTPGQTGTTEYSNPTSFNGAATGITTIGFNGILPAGTPNLDFNPLIVSGASFSTPQPSTDVNVTTSTFYTPNNYSGDFIVDSSNGNPTNQLVISLPSPTFAVGLNFGALGFRGASSGNITLSNGFVLPLSSLPTVGQIQFAGFVSGTQITSLTYTVSSDDWVLLNLQIAAANVTLPSATEGTAYTQILLEQGGVGPLTWTLASGTLPPGISLTASGFLQGTPTAGGVYTFTVNLTDSSTPPKSVSSGSLILTVAPQPPTIDGFGVNSSNQPQIFWVASAPSDVVGYNVYRATTPGGPYTKIASLNAGATTFADPNAQAGITYYYVVTAVGPGNTESVNSNEVSVTVPG